MTRKQNVISLRFVVAVLLIAAPATLSAADPSDYLSDAGQHRLFRGYMPPGSIGQARLAGRGPIAGYFQPVAFSGPQGVRFALPDQGVFGEGQDRLQAGMLIGAVYRFRITGIPGAVGAELYPTVELIDRTYPPPGLANRYPIPINLDQEDLEAALDGKLVTRVVVLEDPQTAIPLAQKPTASNAIEVAQHQDALEVADRLGRPVAIVRIGSVTPPSATALMPQFFFGYPAWAPVFQPESPELQPESPEPLQQASLRNPSLAEQP